MKFPSRIAFAACMVLGVASAGAADSAVTVSKRSVTPAHEHTSPRRCAPEIGSRIVRRGAACKDSRGKHYSRDDIERTGETDVGRALQRLDPSVSRRGR